MSELINKLPEMKDKLEELLYMAIELFKIEDVPRKRLALDRAIRHILHACSEVYKANLVMQTAYVEKLVKKEEEK